MQRQLLAFSDIHSMKQSDAQEANVLLDYSTEAEEPLKQTLMARSVKIALIVALYWFDLQLDAPLFVTWFQCVVTFVLCCVAVTYQSYGRDIDKGGIVFDLSKLALILPLSVIFVFMVTANNLCLKFVSVAFYYIGRSTTIVFNVVFSYLILRQTSSLKVIACCAAIVGGFLLGVKQENAGSSFSLVGVVFGLASSLFVALNAIYTKKKLPVVGEDIWQLAMYNNANACVLFLPCIAAFGEVQELVQYLPAMSLKQWTLLGVSGLFGFAISYVTVLQVKATSALTHNISATAKSAFQTVLAVLVYPEAKDVLWWASNVVVLLASMAYSHVRHGEMRRDANCAKNVRS